MIPLQNERFDGYREWLAIDASQSPVDHYRLLGIARFETNRAVINQATTLQAARLRPQLDGPHGAEAQRLLDEVLAAHACLLDPHAKSHYDATLHAHVDGSVPHTVPMGPPVLPARPAATPVGPPVPSAPRATVAGAADQQQPRQECAPIDQHHDDAERQPFFRQTWFILLLLSTIAIGLSTAGGVGLWMLRQSSESVNRKPQLPAPTGNGEPLVDGATDTDSDGPVIQPQTGGEMLLTAELASAHSASLKLEVRGERNVLAGWHTVDDWASWQIEAPAGLYDLAITYAVNEPGGEYQIDVDDAIRSRRRSVRGKSTEGEFVTDRWQIALRKSGQKSLKMRAILVPGNELLVLESIRLIPRGR